MSTTTQNMRLTVKFVTTGTSAWNGKRDTDGVEVLETTYSCRAYLDGHGFEIASTGFSSPYKTERAAVQACKDQIKEHQSFMAV